MNSVLGKIRSAARFAKAAVVPRGIILLYHRVARQDCDPQALCVSPEHFAEHMEIIARSFRPAGLLPLSSGLGKTGPPRGAVAVTFDDGYRDNLYGAKPALERFGVPATVYVTTGHAGIGREFWWDEVERVLLGPGELPGSLPLTAGGKTRLWDLGVNAGRAAEDPANASMWSVLDAGFPTRRHEVYSEVVRLLHGLSGAERAAAVESLVEWSGLGTQGRTSHLCMDPDEIVRLTEGGLVDVGAHTVTHPVMSSLDCHEQATEVRESRACLEDITGHAVDSFSYPFGNHGSYTAETVGIVKDAGFKNACANMEGTVSKKTDPYQLPRFLVRDWDGDEFLNKLRQWSRYSN